MKTKYIGIVFSVMMVSCHIACSKIEDGSIEFINNSSYTLFIDQSFEYPDTTTYPVMIKVGSRMKNKSHIVEPYSSNSFALMASTLRENYESVMSSKNQDTLVVYVFDNSVVSSVMASSVEPDTLFKHRMWLRCYCLSLDDLNQMGWTITYP